MYWLYNRRVLIIIFYRYRIIFYILIKNYRERCIDGRVNSCWEICYGKSSWCMCCNCMCGCKCDGVEFVCCWNRGWGSGSGSCF